MLPDETKEVEEFARNCWLIGLSADETYRRYNNNRSMSIPRNYWKRVHIIIETFTLLESVRQDTNYIIKPTIYQP